MDRCRSGHCEVLLSQQEVSQIVLQQCLHRRLRGFLGMSWASTCAPGRSTRALPFSRVPEPTLHEAPGSHKETLLVEAPESLRAVGTPQGLGSLAVCPAG